MHNCFSATGKEQLSLVEKMKVIQNGQICETCLVRYIIDELQEEYGEWEDRKGNDNVCRFCLIDVYDTQDDLEAHVSSYHSPLDV